MDSTTHDDETVVRVDETTAMMAVHLPRIQNLAVGVPVWRSGRGLPLPTTRQYYVLARPYFSLVDDEALKLRLASLKPQQKEP